MITCPNCNHQNPDGALQCEACYTPLPVMVACPNCNAPVQADASFCGQCGNDLRGVREAEPTEGSPPSPAPDIDLPELVEPDALIEPEPVTSPTSPAFPESPNLEAPEILAPPAPPVAPSVAPPVAPPANATQLQSISARLRQVQTDTLIEIPRQLSIVRIGKPNDQTPPDIDVSGFPNSEVVSRAHANLLVEGDVYYLEDVGSSNGTYINGLPLPAGNRHRLRPGDRIALGKGDKVSFIFEMAS
ncbi:MAG: FHA domain-containing protein [Phormidesmis sp.]